MITQLVSCSICWQRGVIVSLRVEGLVQSCHICKFTHIRIKQIYTFAGTSAGVEIRYWNKPAYQVYNNERFLCSENHQTEGWLNCFPIQALMFDQTCLDCSHSQLLAISRGKSVTHLKLRCVKEVLRGVALNEGQSAGEALCENVPMCIRVCANASARKK